MKKGLGIWSAVGHSEVTRRAPAGGRFPRAALRPASLRSIHSARRRISAASFPPGDWKSGVEGEIECQHVDAGVPEHAKVGTLRVLVDQLLDGLGAHAARRGHPILLSRGVR